MEEVITFSQKIKERSKARKERWVAASIYTFLWMAVTYFSAHFLAAFLCGRFR